MPERRDRPWIMRTYSGHTSAEASNELFRRNLARGQTGLSVAFDLPTQIGYDADQGPARGEVGKVGVPVAHLGDMRTLFRDIPLADADTSMTINATAVWLLALYRTVAEEQGADPSRLRGTTQNDILKEYLARGTYAFPPGPSLRLTSDLIAHTVTHMPRWNPVNICSYHLQEAGATPVQEIAFTLADAIAVLDAVRARDDVPADVFPRVVGRISFFVNAGIRFVDEACKMRAFVTLWDRITERRYGISDPALRRFRYGVQVNSLGLTEQQPENNIARILLEMLGVTLSRGARARAIQLPAWNEALGLPRPWDQQLSLRMQQVLAHETDLLEHGDILAGAPVVEKRTAELVDAAETELRHVLDRGGAVEALGYMKAELVRSGVQRLRGIETGAQQVVGVNCFTDAEPSPLVGSGAASLAVDPLAAAEQVSRLVQWRAARDQRAVTGALDDLRAAARTDTNLVPPSLRAARAGATTGEWAAALRDVFGEYRPATGVSGSAVPAPSGPLADRLADAEQEIRAAERRLGRRIRLLVGKPGLDGHSTGAEQIAVRARDLGMEVVYEGIRLTPAQIVRAAVDEDVHGVGLSILSGSHAVLVPEVLAGLRAAHHDVPVIVGGIIPPGDAEALLAGGVAAVFTPKDYDLTRVLVDIARIVADRAVPSA